MGGTSFTQPAEMVIAAIGFATGAALCTLMAVLQWRTSRHSESVWVFLLIWASGVIWTLGCFTEMLLRLGGQPDNSDPVVIAQTFSFISTSIGPVMMAFVVNREAPSRSPLRRAMLGISCVMSIALLLGFLATAAIPSFSLLAIDIAAISFFATLGHLVVYGAIWLLTPRAQRRPNTIGHASRWFYLAAAALIAFEAFAIPVGVGLFHVPRNTLLHAILRNAAPQWPIPAAIIGAAFLARAHAMDVVLKRSLILLAAVAIGVALTWPLLPPGPALVLTSLAITAAILLAPHAQRALGRFVDRALLRRPDYRAMQEALAAKAPLAANRDDLFALVADVISQALHLNARFLAPDTTKPPGLARFPLHNRGGDLLLDLSVTTLARPLLQEERRFLDAIIAETGRRLDAIAFEHERRERELRETRLRHSAAEAELRALRAQVDPHFLFNTLNTIADLVSTDPARAEEMTERLAEFFRYTLARQDRMVSTLDEELAFTRRYLEIEQVRFGGRLRIAFSKDPSLGAETVPSLILQPLVENAVRHGLAPRREGGCVSISASRSNGALLLEVDDDGVGMQPACAASGIGLSNVRARLQGLYGDASYMSIGPGPEGRGTRIRLMLPE